MVSKCHFILSSCIMQLDISDKYETIFDKFAFQKKKMLRGTVLVLVNKWQLILSSTTVQPNECW